MLNYFLHAENLEEDQKFQVVIEDSQYDSHNYTEIVDLSFGMGAQYLMLKGCIKNEKLAKITRFCQIKSGLYAKQ